MKRILAKLLNLEGIVVETSLEEGNTLILSVSKSEKKATCPTCGKRSDKLHQNQKHLVKDLPMGIDEISLVKGQGKFVVVLVDIDTGKLIGLVRER